MKTLLCSLIFVFALAVVGAAQACVESAKAVPPVLSTETRAAHEAKLAEAKAQHEKTPNDANAIIWLARRYGYLGEYKEAIKTLTIGVQKHSNDARMYRHRGHRFITLRCFDDAIIDLTKAAKLIKGKTDEVEPDGIPNALNTPTSTLQSNIWYHLGLAYYLKGDNKRALDAYRECIKVSKNNDMLAATSHWLYMTLRRLEKNRDAERVLESIDGDFEVIENADYLKLLRLYRGEVRPEMLLNEIGEKAETLGNASLGYGIGNWYQYTGDRVMAMQIFRRITAGNQWASFGFIAAEAELSR